MNVDLTELTQENCNYTRLFLTLRPTCLGPKVQKTTAKLFFSAKIFLGDTFGTVSNIVPVYFLRVSDEQTSPQSRYPPHFVETCFERVLPPIHSIIRYLFRDKKLVIQTDYFYLEIRKRYQAKIPKSNKHSLFSKFPNCSDSQYPPSNENGG